MAGQHEHDAALHAAQGAGLPANEASAIPAESDLRQNSAELAASLVPQSPMSVPPEIQATNLLKKLDDNPALRIPAARMLHACANDRQEEVALLERMQNDLAATGDLPVQPLSSLVEMLVRCGALVEELEVDGVPYEGTIEDAFNDESIPEESEVLIYEVISECGRITLAGLDPARRASSLFAERAEYKDALVRTLQLCDVPGGLTTKQLEKALDADGYLYRDKRTNIPHVYPSMYANFLKDVDCIAWDHAWITTDLGRELACA